LPARQTLGVGRQIFFVSQSSYDTHNTQLERQGSLFADLSPALAAFYAATVQLGVAQQVTSFTLSDFSRTLQPASGDGSDHAWGNHHLVLGGAVKGRQTYGTFPTLELGGTGRLHQPGPLGPDDGGGPVRRHAGHLVRGERCGPANRPSLRGPLPDRQPGLPRLTSGRGAHLCPESTGPVLKRQRCGSRYRSGTYWAMPFPKLQSSRPASTRLTTSSLGETPASWTSSPIRR
jgi:hypothetical protein